QACNDCTIQEAVAEEDVVGLRVGILYRGFDQPSCIGFGCRPQAPGLIERNLVVAECIPAEILSGEDAHLWLSFRASRSSSCDREAIRVLSKTGSWSPQVMSSMAGPA